MSLLWCGPSGPKLVYMNSDSVPSFEIRMRLPEVYWMSEDEFAEFLVEVNTAFDNHFMNFLDLLKTKWYPIIILLNSIRRVFLPVLSGYVEFEEALPDPS